MSEIEIEVEVDPGVQASFEPCGARCGCALEYSNPSIAEYYQAHKDDDDEWGEGVQDSS